MYYESTSMRKITYFILLVNGNNILLQNNKLNTIENLTTTLIST